MVHPSSVVYRVRSSTLFLVKSYLTNRSRFVTYNCDLEYTEFESWTLVFNIFTFINDVYKEINNYKKLWLCIYYKTPFFLNTHPLYFSLIII